MGSNSINNLNLLGTEGSEGDCGASKRRRRRGNWKRKHNKYTAGYTSNVKKEKKRPLLKGAKMIDKRTKDGKASMVDRETSSARDLAARAALSRFGSTVSSASSSHAHANAKSTQEMISVDFVNAYNDGKSGEDSGGEENEEDEFDEPIKDHNNGCGCRSCDWSNLFLLD